MKKLSLFVLFLVLMLTQISWASYYQVDIDGLGINGFGVDIITAHDSPQVADFAVSSTLGWWVYAATNPKTGIQGANVFGGDSIDASAGPVTAFTVEASYDFTLDNFLLTDAIGHPIITPYVVLFNGTDTYTCSPSAVPIPGAVWLLGSGFLGLVAIRRRRAKG